MRPSVITLTKNRTDHLKNLCKGLMLQREDLFELVVVVMGGEDPCVDPEFKELQSQMPTKLIYLYEQGLPLAKARNLGAQSAASDHLIFLDVDCVPSQNMVKEYAELLKATDESTIIMGQVRYLEQGHLERNSLPLAINAGVAHPERDYSETHRETRYELFWSLSFACSRKIYELIGGFDERFKGYGGEDTDFSLSAKAHGIPLISSDRPLCFHQFHQTCEPPLNHFEDIIANAGYFKNKWGRACMEGWISSFQEMGLIDEAQTIQRLPNGSELEESMRPSVL